MAWGGVVAVEHRLPDDSFVTTVYGHLDTKLLVALGDIVQTGQPIGAIGSKRVNGGYLPHLHFGVRTGRIVEKVRALMPVSVGGRITTLRIQDFTEERLVLTGGGELPDRLRLDVAGKDFELQKRNDAVEVAANILWHIQPPDFAIVGYGLSTEGWLDPVAFLRDPLTHPHALPHPAD
jgi:murein DD-endopeptidase MepM/ murein hydrolase activator NlpD